MGMAREVVPVNVWGEGGGEGLTKCVNFLEPEKKWELFKFVTGKKRLC